jgi:hypothetical protein
MATTYEFLGQGDSSGEWFASASQFFGSALKAMPFIGQNDSSGEWFSSSIQFEGPALRSIPWLGQLDAGGDWMDINGKYVGSPVNNLYSKTIKTVVANPTSSAQTGSDWQNIGALINPNGYIGYVCYTENKAAQTTAYAYNFGFTIPSNAIITGAAVYFTGSGFDVHGTPVPTALDVSLVTTGGSPIGSSKYQAVSINGFFNLGGETDNWSAGLTPAIVNSSNFGVGFKVDNANGAFGSDAWNAYMQIWYYVPTFATSVSAFTLPWNAWLPAIYMFTRDFWGTLATPYAGQLFPTGGNNANTSGQVYPF